ncbi:MAG TPA: fibronectin type III domain-containing protein [Thermoanaerobaculia bacterium]|nr:fibronectin type III domain-containing protein [Thermoanaerobaculia bacterium]
MRHFLVLCALVLATSASAAVPSSERAALLAIHDATGGANWTNRDGWGGAEGTECDWYGVACSEDGGNVTDLELYVNNLDGTLPAAIGNLTKLRNLQLWQNNLRGPLPNELGQLAELEDIYAGNNHFTGTVPASLGALKKIVYLFLDGNQLEGPLPPQLGDMTALQELGLSYNKIGGTIPPQLANLTNLVALDLGSNQLEGSIPPDFGSLQKFERLVLTDNRLTGGIPPQLGNAAALKALYLSYNDLGGTIPPDLGRLRDLEQLNLTNNELTGTIPDALRDLTSLKQFDLTTNFLTGPLPSALWAMTSLEELGLGDNGFTGPLSPDVARLTSLQVLGLYANGLTGTIPVELTTIAPLRSLELHANDMEGAIPAELSRLTNLTWLDLSGNRFSGTIPPQLGTLTELQVLQLYSNLLDGTIPPELGQLTKLTILSVADNRLTGTIPDSLRNLRALEQFYVNGNALGGPLPSWIGEWTNVRDLFFSYNQFSGTVPPGFSTLEHLQYLDLGDNRLTGSIPDLSRLTSLRYLTLPFNGFTGPLPASIGALTNLEYARFDNNALSGPLPLQIGNLARLDSLDLSNNSFEGSLPAELGALTALTQLSLWGNRFEGTIPRELGNLTRLLRLDLSFNALRGPFPDEITQLTSLQDDGSDFSFNALFASDANTHAFVNQKQYGNYEETQTVTPANVEITSATDRSVTLRWTTILYDYDNGGYQVVASTTPGGPPAAIATTSGKNIDSITVRNLAPSTPYFLRVSTVTHPHAYQENLIVSDPSPQQQVTTGPRVVAPAEIILSDAPNGMVQVDGVEVGEDSFTVTNFGDVTTTVSLERSEDFFTFTPETFTLAGGASRVVTLHSLSQPPGTYYGYVAIRGEGAADDLLAYVVLLSSARPSGTVTAEPLATRIELAGEPGSDSVGVAQFRNSGTAQLTGIVVSDQPWVEVAPEKITIDPGTVGSVNFTVVRAKRPAESEGSLTANLSLIYVSGDGPSLLATTSPVISISKVTIVDITKPPVASGLVPPLGAGELAFFVPGISATGGARDDVSIVNAFGSRSVDDLRLYFLRPGSVTVANMRPLGFSQSVDLANVVSSVYSATGSGTLQIRSTDSGSLGAAAKATVVTAEGTRGGAIPVFRADRSIPANESLYLTGLIAGGDLLVQETAGAAGKITIDLLDASGNVLATRNENVAAFGLLELNGVIPANAVTAIVANAAGHEAWITAYARLRDAAGDTWSVADWSRFYGYERSEAVRVPFADAEVPGEGGGGRRRSVRATATARVTDLALFNPGSAEVRATLQSIDATGRTSERLLVVPAHATITARAAGAHVVVTPGREDLVVTARSHDTGGGSAIPILSAAAGLRLGQSQVFSGLDDSAAVRTGYGLTETAGAAVKVRATIIFDNPGAKTTAVTSRTYSLAPREQLLIPELVRSFAGPARDTLFDDLHGLVLQLEVVEGAGAVVPFVVATDLGTGDTSLDVRP